MDARVNVPQMGGNTALAKGSMKYQYLQGRKDNLAGKAKFKSGPHARNVAGTSSTRRTDPASAEGV